MRLHWVQPELTLEKWHPGHKVHATKSSQVQETYSDARIPLASFPGFQPTLLISFLLAGLWFYSLWTLTFPADQNCSPVESFHADPWSLIIACGFKNSKLNLYPGHPGPWPAILHRVPASSGWSISMWIRLVNDQIICSVRWLYCLVPQYWNKGEVLFSLCLWACACTLSVDGGQTWRSKCK